MTAIRYDFNNGMIMAIGLVGIALVLAIVFVVQGWFWHMEEKSFQQQNGGVPLQVQQYKTEQAEKLSTYGWVDREKNQVRIPLERAKYTVLKEMVR